MNKILKILKWLIIVIISILILVTCYYSITELFLKENLNKEQEIYISTHYYNDDIQFSVGDFWVERRWYIGPSSRSQFNIFRYPGMAFHKEKKYYLCFKGFDTPISLPERRSFDWFTDTGYRNGFYHFQSDVEESMSYENQKGEQKRFLDFLRQKYDPLNEDSLRFIKTAKLFDSPNCAGYETGIALATYNVATWDDYGAGLRGEGRHVRQYPINAKFNEILNNEITYEEFQKKLKEYLIDENDINTIDEYGNTLLSSAVGKGNFDSEEELLKRISFLLEKGASPNIVLDKNNGGGILNDRFNGYQPNNLDIIKILVEHGADVNMKNNRNENSLWAVKNVEIASFLTESGADVCTKNFQGKTLKDSASYYIQNPNIGSWCNKNGSLAICEFYVNAYDEKCDNTISE